MRRIVLCSGNIDFVSDSLCGGGLADVDGVGAALWWGGTFPWRHKNRAHRRPTPCLGGGQLKSLSLLTPVRGSAERLIMLMYGGFALRGLGG